MKGISTLRTLLNLTTELVLTRMTRAELVDVRSRGKQEGEPLLFRVDAPQNARIGKSLLLLGKRTVKLRISILLYQRKALYEIVAQWSVFVIDMSYQAKIQLRTPRYIL